jgi:hypothetical protein
MVFTSHPGQGRREHGRDHVRGEVGSLLGIGVSLGDVCLRQGGWGVEAGPPGERANRARVSDSVQDVSASRRP